MIITSIKLMILVIKLLFQKMQIKKMYVGSIPKMTKK